MSKKDKQAAAARARAARHPGNRSNSAQSKKSKRSRAPVSRVSIDNPSMSPAADIQCKPLFDDDPPGLPDRPDEESDSDCGYDGGVNHDGSDNETDAWYSDVESLCEFEGDELDSNLEMLKAAFAADGDVFEDLMAKRTTMDWKKVEKRRSLGYNGQSVRRQQELAKKAKEDAATREAAKTS
jgi:hypothetical protein